MKTGVDPKVDYVFKRLFGSEDQVALPIEMFNAVLDFPPGIRVRQIALLNPFTDAGYAGGKLAVLDVKARDEIGRQFHVEMQRQVPWSFDKRVVYYAAGLHAQQMQKGDYYETICPTYSISFVNEPLFDDPHYHHKFVLHDVQHGVTFSKDLEVHIIELSLCASPHKLRSTKWTSRSSKTLPVVRSRKRKT